MDTPPPESQRLHNVRNHLSVIIGYCDLLLTELRETDSRHKDILEIRKAAYAAMALLQDDVNI
jgi:hypothetical protein